MRVVALTACYNRREKTERSIAQILTQRLPGGCTLEVCLVDDASSDGTRDAIRSTYPSVTVLEGSGSLFWAGGMRFGWQNWCAARDPDYLLAFNDDVELFANALEILLQTARDVEEQGCRAYAIAGAFIDSKDGGTAYGAVRRASRWHTVRFARVTPSGALQSCDTLNMNLALISREALRSTGFLAPEFTHGRADFDFGLRLRKLGGQVFLAPHYVGRCARNETTSTSLQKDAPFRVRWHRLVSVKEQPPRERMIYYRRHAGWRWPVLWVLPYASLVTRACGSAVRRALSGIGRRISKPLGLVDRR